MNYEKMWYQLKNQMLESVDRGLTTDAVLKRMGRLEVIEILGESKTDAKPIVVKVVVPDKFSPEVLREIQKAVKNWDVNL